MNSLEMTPSNEVSASEAMLQMISGFWVSQAIYAAAQLGIADYLQEQPKTVEELATITATHAPSLYRLLRALASVGIFAEDANHRFSLTPLATTLQTDAPGSLRFFAISELGQEHYRGWGNLLHSIKTGEIAFDNVAGMNIWDYYQQNPEDGKLFNQSMTNLTASVLKAIICSYDFSPFQTIVDVGGGQGSLATTILQAYPTVKAIIFDVPTVTEEAKYRLQALDFADPSGISYVLRTRYANGDAARSRSVSERDTQSPAEGFPPAAPQFLPEGNPPQNCSLSHRCTVVSGNFFESIPAGGDVYLFKHIIHDWDEEKSIAILKNCYESIPQHGKVLLFEIVVPPGNEPSFSKFLDLNMLVMVGGRERTEEEYRTLLQAAGFQLTRIIPTSSPISVIEAVKM